RLSRSVRTEQADNRAARDVERDAAQHLCGVVPEGNAIDRQQRVVSRRGGYASGSLSASLAPKNGRAPMARFPDSRIVATRARLPKPNGSVTGPRTWNKSRGPGTKDQSVSVAPRLQWRDRVGIEPT